jgi:hypothetical protein
LFATGVVYTGGKFATGVVDTGGKLPPALVTPVANFPPVSLTPVANLPSVSTTLAKMEHLLPVLLIQVVRRWPICHRYQQR